MKHLFIVNPVAGGKDRHEYVAEQARLALEGSADAYEVYITTAPMDACAKIAAEAAYVSVLPEGTTTDSMTAIDGLTTAGVEGAVKTANGDVAVKAAASGYSGKDVTVYVAFDAEGAISGISIDGSTQTTGIGSKVSGDSFASGFIGWNGGEVASGSPVDSIAGATYSSNGAFNAINAAIDCYNNEIKGVQ